LIGNDANLLDILIRSLFLISSP